MKLNEINGKKQVSEGVVGSVAKSIGSSMIGKPKSASQYQVKDKFIKNFASQIQNELEPELASGTVTIGGQELDPRNPADAKILQQIQQQQGIKAPAATPAATPTATPTTVPQSPEQTRRAKQQAAASAAQAQMRPVAQRTAQAPQTPEQIRLAKQKAAAAAAQAQMNPVRESYDKLNQVFEGIMNLSEQQTVTDYVTKKTEEYLGPDSQQYARQIRSLAASVEQAYKSKGVSGANASLTALGNLVYKIATAKQAAYGGRSYGGASYAQPNAALTQVNSVLPKLNPNDLMQIKKNVDSLLVNKR